MKEDKKPRREEAREKRSSPPPPHSGHCSIRDMYQMGQAGSYQQTISLDWVITEFQSDFDNIAIGFGHESNYPIHSINHVY